MSKICYFVGQRDLFDNIQELPLFGKLLGYLGDNEYEVKVLEHYLTFKELNTLQVPCTFCPENLKDVLIKLNEVLEQKSSQEFSLIFIFPLLPPVHQDVVFSLSLLR